MDSSSQPLVALICRSRFSFHLAPNRVDMLRMYRFLHMNLRGIVNRTSNIDPGLTVIHLYVR